VRGGRAIAKASPLPLVTDPPLPAPTTLSCLNCQLLGRRRLLCSRADACREIPHSFALGPLMLLGWMATLVAFILAVV
jgi:hypothetical protein